MVAYVAARLLALSNGGARAVARRSHDGFEHRDVVHFVASRQRERLAGGGRLGEMLELGPLGAGLGKVAELGPLLAMRIGRVEEAHLHVPRMQVLDIADLDPALRAEDLHAPGLGRGDHGAEVAGRPFKVLIVDVRDKQLLAFEKDVLGCYVTSNPLLRYEEILRTLSSATVDRMPDLQDGTEVTIGGMISGLRAMIQKTGKNAGQKYVMFKFADLTGTTEAVCFAGDFEKNRDHLLNDAIVFCAGRIGFREDSPSLRVSLVTPSPRVSEWADHTMEQERIQGRLMELGVEPLTSKGLLRADAGGVQLGCTYTGRESDLECDALLLVTSRLPNDELAQSLAGSAGSVRAVGDAYSPGTIAAAVWDGRRYAEELDAEPADPDETPFLREVAELSPDRVRDPIG